MTTWKKDKVIPNAVYTEIDGKEILIRTIYLNPCDTKSKRYKVTSNIPNFIGEDFKTLKEAKHYAESEVKR